MPQDPRKTAAKKGMTYYEYVTNPKPADYVPTEQEQEFIYNLVELGMKPQAAAEEAGYSVGNPTLAYARQKRLAPQIAKVVQSRLQAGASLAINTLMQIMEDKKVAPSTRLKAATEWMDRSGFGKQVEMTFRDETKTIDDYTQEELREQMMQKMRKLQIIPSNPDLTNVTEIDATNVVADQ